MKLLSLFILFSQVLFAKEIATIQFVKGKAFVIRDKKEITAKKGFVLSEGDEVNTYKKSFVLIKFPDSISAKIDPHSSVDIEKYYKEFKVHIKKGASFFKVEKKQEKTFKVNTRNISLAVRGTTFFTSYDKMSSKSWTCVQEGEVEVLDLKTKGTLLLKEGLGLSADSSHGMSSPAILEWTKGLNWSFDSKSDSLNKVGIDEINRNYLNTDYE